MCFGFSFSLPETWFSVGLDQTGWGEILFSWVCSETRRARRWGMKVQNDTWFRLFTIVHKAFLISIVCIKLSDSYLIPEFAFFPGLFPVGLLWAKLGIISICPVASNVTVAQSSRRRREDWGEHLPSFVGTNACNVLCNRAYLYINLPSSFKCY